MNISDTLITFETAKLAKEKGFNISSRSDGVGMDIFADGKLIHTIFYNENHIYAPTQALLQKWLRKVHKINVYCIPTDEDNELWYNNIASHYVPFRGTYEEALEVGLQEALKLI
jgi:hypothetical protein